ncbi:MAG: cation:proton antiporter, partial [Candidatus Altiarchaeales archaeon HGW-Altiarchaeales-2]
MNGEVLIYALLPSLIAAFILPLFKNKPNLRDSVTVVATIITFLLIAFLVLPPILDGENIALKLFEFAPGITFTLKLDAFGMFFAFVTATLWVVTNIYAIGYMRGLKEHAQTRFFVYFTLSIFAALGIAFSGNLITYPLVIHEQDPKSMRSGTEYMIYLMVASMLLQLTAILLIYGITGTLEFGEGGIGALAQGGSMLLFAIFLMLMFGYAKAAIFPLHSWLPTAMVAPTPVSALLHAVAVVVAGVFCVMRTVFDVFGPNLMHSLNLDIVLGIFAAFTLLAAIFFGITQDNLKRRVAYSTVSQLSFMLLGVAL